MSNPDTRNKLTPNDIHKIRRKLSDGMSYSVIAENHEPRLNVSTVGRIARGETWGWLQIQAAELREGV